VRAFSAWLAGEDRPATGGVAEGGIHKRTHATPRSR
jgi:hypothetical protein